MPFLRKQFAIQGIFRKNPHIARESGEHDFAFELLRAGEKFVQNAIPSRSFLVQKRPFLETESAATCSLSASTALHSKKLAFFI